MKKPIPSPVSNQLAAIAAGDGVSSDLVMALLGDAISRGDLEAIDHWLSLTLDMPPAQYLSIAQSIQANQDPQARDKFIGILRSWFSKLKEVPSQFNYVSWCRTVGDVIAEGKKQGLICRELLVNPRDGQLSAKHLAQVLIFAILSCPKPRKPGDSDVQKWISHIAPSLEAAGVSAETICSTVGLLIESHGRSPALRACVAERLMSKACEARTRPKPPARPALGL